MILPLTAKATAIWLLLVLMAIANSFPLQAPAEENGQNPSGAGKKEWSSLSRGGYVHQSTADLDDGGSFSVDRLFVQGGASYSFAPRQSVSLTVGYGFDGYDFSGERNPAPAVSWDDVHSFRISLPVRWGTGERWTIIAVPSLRFTGEYGADWGEAITGGGIAGFFYRVNDRLSLGPGIGIFSQLEDNASLFPIILLSWQITDKLSLDTGSGLAATMGPGLALNWKMSEQWELHAGGRYEKQRFRLDSEGPAPEGIGEKTSLPLVIGATYSFNRDAAVTLIAGLPLAGELRLEDDAGQLLVRDRYEPSGFIGITFRLRL